MKTLNRSDFGGFTLIGFLLTILAIIILVVFAVREYKNETVNANLPNTNRVAVQKNEPLTDVQQRSKETRELMIQSRAGNLDKVKHLVEHGADVNATIDGGVTALMAAAVYNLEVTKYLVEHGANINAMSDNGDTALSLAASADQFDTVKYLLNHGAGIQGKDALLLISAVSEDNLDMVKYFVEHGVNVNAKEETTGLTALLLATSKRNFDIVKYLVEHGADVNVRYEGYTAAEITQDPQIKAFLLQTAAKQKR